jgi:hypothetical protein
MLIMTLSVINALAGAEYVTLIKVLDNEDQGIIERRNGERWLIEKGVGALSFWRFEGKKIIVNSPGIFCGVGSKVILPDVDQQARIWNAEQIDGGGAAPVAPKQLTDPQITAAALAFLGYFDPKSNKEEKSDLVLSMKAFQKAQRIAPTGKMSSESQIALAKAVTTKKPATKQSLQLSGLLLDSAKRLMNPARPAPNRVVPAVGNKIESQIDGDFEGWEGETVVKLTNGQVWQQTEFHYHYHYAFMPKVTILKTATGHKMIVDGVPKATGVTLLK